MKFFSQNYQKEPRKNQNQKSVWVLFEIIVLVTILLIVICGLIIIYWPRLGTGFYNQHSVIDAILYYLTAIATVAIVVVAYNQIKKISENNESEFLLRIDERWTSKEILQARTIIHGIYLCVRQEKHLDTESLIQEEIGKRIKKMSEDMAEKQRFMYVLNLLDFMETIGYLHKVGNIEKDGLEALLGESIIFHYNVFKPYIEYKRFKHNNPKFYTEFEKLYRDLTAESSHVFDLTSSLVRPQR